jgi:CheY-like chemotaxis protein
MALITNAAEAIGDCTGRITVQTGVRTLSERDLPLRATGAEVQPGRYALIEVTDSGRGMDQATIERIFDPFFSTKQSGRGLGLAATLGIIRSHGGALQVESDPGRGSTFRVLLPLSVGDHQFAESHTQNRAMVQTLVEPYMTSQQRTVLVVDDETAVRTVTVRMVERLGYQTMEASDGQVGVDTFKAHADSIICVLLDVTMPVMSGAQALQAIRAIRPDVPVVLMSGYTNEETSARFELLRPNCFLHKPFDSAELQACLNAAIGANE